MLVYISYAVGRCLFSILLLQQWQQQWGICIALYLKAQSALQHFMGDFTKTAFLKFFIINLFFPLAIFFLCLLSQHQQTRYKNIPLTKLHYFPTINLLDAEMTWAFLLTIVITCWTDYSSGIIKILEINPQRCLS